MKRNKSLKIGLICLLLLFVLISFGDCIKESFIYQPIPTYSVESSDYWSYLPLLCCGITLVEIILILSASRQWLLSLSFALHLIKTLLPLLLYKLGYVVLYKDSAPVSDLHYSLSTLGFLLFAVSAVCIVLYIKLIKKTPKTKMANSENPQPQSTTNNLSTDLAAHNTINEKGTISPEISQSQAGSSNEKTDPRIFTRRAKNEKYKECFLRYYEIVKQHCEKMIYNTGYKEEILPAIFVICDYAVLSANGDRKKAADEIMPEINERLTSTFNSTVFSKRVELYGEIIRGKELHAFWLFGNPAPLYENAVTRVSGLLGDVLFHFLCADNYDNTNLSPSFYLKDGANITAFSQKVMWPIVADLKNLYQEIYDISLLYAPKPTGTDQKTETNGNSDEAYVYAEAANGMIARIPVSKLQEWKKTQEEIANGTRKVDESAVQALRDYIMKL